MTILKEYKRCKRIKKDKLWKRLKEIIKGHK